MASERNYCSDRSVESFGRIACCCVVELGVDAGASLHLSNFAFYGFEVVHLVLPHLTGSGVRFEIENLTFVGERLTIFCCLLCVFCISGVVICVIGGLNLHLEDIRYWTLDDACCSTFF